MKNRFEMVYNVGIYNYFEKEKGEVQKRSADKACAARGGGKGDWVSIKVQSQTPKQTTRMPLRHVLKVWPKEVHNIYLQFVKVVWLV